MNNEVEIVVTADNKTQAGYKQAEAGAKTAGAEAGKGFSKTFEAGTEKTTVSKRALTGLVAGVGVAATAAAGAFASGFAKNMEIEVATDKLQGQLDLTTAQAAKASKTAGQIYADNWGESVADVDDALASVQTNIGNISNMAPQDLKKITEGALAIADAFNVDVSESTRAAGKLIKNGLAKNATEAFDLITYGMQHGLNASDDFLETLDEYSPQFAKLGINGKQTLGILSTFLKAGARDTDVAADAFKEFSIRAIDGSVTTKDAYKSLGISGKKMGEQIAEGGKGAVDGLNTVIKKLQDTKDPVEQNRIGVELFGTQWEDTVRQILPKLDAVNEGVQGVDGSTQDLANTLGDNAAGRIETLKRGFENWTKSMSDSDSVFATVVTGVMEFGAPVLTAAGALGQLVAGLAAVNVGATITAVSAAAATAAEWAVTAATTAWAAATWLLDAALIVLTSPITITIAIILALAAAIVVAYKRVGWFRAAVDGSFNAIKGAARSMGNAVVAAFNRLRSAVTSARSRLSSLVTTFRGIPGRIRSAFSGMYAAITNPIRNAVQAVQSWLAGLVQRARNIPKQIGGAIRGVIPGFAHGGVVGAATGGARGGMVMVGEHGRELVSLPFGSTVHTNGATENMMKAGGQGGGGTTVLEIRSDGTRVGDFLIEVLRKSVIQRGGNVQVVFGGRS